MDGFYWHVRCEDANLKITLSGNFDAQSFASLHSLLTAIGQYSGQTSRCTIEASDLTLLTLAGTILLLTLMREMDSIPIIIFDANQDVLKTLECFDIGRKLLRRVNHGCSSTPELAHNY